MLARKKCSIELLVYLLFFYNYLLHENFTVSARVAELCMANLIVKIVYPQIKNNLGNQLEHNMHNLNTMTCTSDTNNTIWVTCNNEIMNTCKDDPNVMK